MRDQKPGIGSQVARFDRDGKKVAVWAFFQAKGDVDVERGCFDVFAQ